MTISIIITINNRSDDVCRQVAESLRLPGNQANEMIVVLDRPEDSAREAAKRNYSDIGTPVRFVSLDGEPGWRSPVIAWNHGFKAATSDAIYCFSSETLQAEGNIKRARALLADGTTLIQGKAECSCGPDGQEVNWGGTAPGNLFCDAAHPRPLGFIWAAPTKNVRDIGGFDEGFAKGFWHDDDDLFIRLWRTGLDFVFDDAIHGVHLHHERPGLSTPEGQKKIQLNAAHLLGKYGTLQPFSQIQRLETREPGRTWWRHL